ncbi:MAG: hypothetical protein QOF55_636, partial [Thermoleophilaceae bacterium]|nr:hypothetical protein [Thermoleophilaceae bacterium]
EVQGVENLLHLPKTPARTKAKSRTPRKRTAAKRVTSERKTAPKSEPAPKDLAAKRKGRQAAPLGSSDNGKS